jgi:predicted metalloprotease with PDZ domain
MHGMSTARWQQGWRRAALGAAAGVVLGAPAARAQQRGTPEPAAAAMRAELADVERQREAVADQLRRLSATLTTQAMGRQTNDSLVALVQRYAVLGNRAAMLNAQLRFRDAELRVRRDAVPRQAPSGWFGVDVETLWNGDVQPGGRVLLSAEYPKVLSVEPGSPAARAGLLAGDRLVAIAGTDLRMQAFDLRGVLQPGRVLPVRIMRDGQLRELRVTVTPRPATFSPGVRMRTATVAEAPRAAEGTMRVRVAGAPPEAAPLPPGAIVMSRGVPVPEASRTPSPVFFFSSPNVVAVAGAEVLGLSPALRETLEVRNGVFVVQVARSSPAERSGLQQGDVLVRANGVALTSPLVFQQVVAAAVQADSGVKVELVRARRTRTVQLRW